ncbi:hypothetical protein [Chelativorans salis]|uniref:Uncharacterized protein n=1 Tax=Chelativorans salis TaxID=2978478 RepID=A0ABT2LP78_9HYPH|nr:hypothetical protein [Chelativorans sp. EGI FJ00035]MCT7375463.1 hypothetical protein [Chelativorans sp. EGI FJ00035]
MLLRLCARLYGCVARFAEPGAIGVHRSSFERDAGFSSTEAVEAVQAITAEVIAYMVEMGVDPTLLQLALSYGSDDVRYLSRSEMEQFRVVTVEDAAPPAAARENTAPIVASRPEDAALKSFVESVIAAHTMTEVQAIAAVGGAYASQVFYYGKFHELSSVLNDKRNYFRRWPERFYAVRPRSTTVKCEDNICSVSGIYDWHVRSEPRNRQASGTATFTFVIDTSQSMRIVGETSEVMHRN